ncbi:MAG: hypothetical protein E7566_08490 [Ruminococcaceae bacterium]|nr:hypothetical protein [Oscillospiraceae bacterium]
MADTNNLKEYYTFDLKNDLPCFTDKNLLLVDALIRYDSNYSVTTDENHPDYKESYAGILSRMKADFFDFNKTDEHLLEVVKSINKINSTHLGAYNGIQLTVDTIKKMENLKERLLNGDGSVVYEIACAGINRYNFSFATKFCTYVSELALETNDKYCIYDNVVQSVLPLYIHHYVSEEKAKEYYKIVNKSKPELSRIESKIDSKLKSKNEPKGYDKYRELINEIIKGIKEKDGKNITYAEFDHLVWYYFKGSEKKVQQALNTLLP